MYDECIAFVKMVDTGEKDEFGDKILSEEKSESFAEMKSIGMKEFYQAQTIGMKPEIVFEIADYEDYKGQQLVDYEDTRYKVLRTYRKGNCLEITCYGGVRNVST